MTFDFAEFLRTNEGDVLLFVYGTLRHDAQPSNSGIVASCGGTLVATDCTVRGRLYDFGRFPGLVADDAAGLVRGEVWRVPVTRMQPISRYEGLLYRRVGVLVEQADGSTFAAEAFVIDGREAKASVLPVIQSGDWVRRTGGAA